MHELYCPSCNTPSQFDFANYLQMCPFCSATFKVDIESGQKEVYNDHYVVPNTMDSGTVKELIMEWLRRLHHRPGLADKEFFVIDIQGMSIPFWVVSVEGHTAWSGLVQKQHKSVLHATPGSSFLREDGQFRRSYRWAVSARENICEIWGLTRIHETKEAIHVEWDGFPLDSTLSRGRLTDDGLDKSAYEVREFFEFKFANGLPILGIQVPEEEALRRARAHIELYHYKLACLHVDHLLDQRTELEIAGVQLIHLPLWNARYIYRPRTFLRHFYKPKEKNVIVDGFGKGVLSGELALSHTDKVTVNAIVTAVSTVLFLMLGSGWHPAFYLVALFSAIISGASTFIAITRKAKAQDEALKKRSAGLTNKVDVQRSLFQS